MKAVVLLKLQVMCDGVPYPLRSRPTPTSLYYVLCACPGCDKFCSETLERWREKDEVDVFTISACNEKQAIHQGRLLELWCEGLRQRGATYSPIGVST